MSRKRWIVLLLAACLLLISLVSLGRMLLHRHIAEAIFFAYAGTTFISLILLSFSFYTFMQNSLVGRVLQGSVRSTEGWDRVVIIALSILELMSAALVWPVTLVHIATNLRRETKLPELARRRMRDVFGPNVQLYTQAFFEFCIAILYSLCEARYVHSQYLGAILDAILIVVMCRHLSLLLSPGGVASRIKQATGNPLIKFAFILLSDLGSLVFVSSAINAQAAGLPLSKDMLRTTFVTLLKGPKALLGTEEFAVGKIITLLQALPVQRRLTLAAGMLFYASLLRLVTSATTILKRNNDENIALAQALIYEEKYKEALKALEDINPPNARSEEVRATALLSSGQFAKAQVAAERALRLDPEVYFQPTKSDVFFQLSKCAMDAPADMRRKLVGEAIREKVSGGLVLQELLAFLGLRMISQDTSEPEWDEMFGNNLIVLATVTLFQKEWEALTKLVALIKPQDEMEELIASVYRLSAAVGSAKDEAEATDAVSRWKSAEWDHGAAIAAKLLPDREWQCTVVCFLLQFVTAFAAPLDREVGEQVEVLNDQAMERMRTAPKGSFLNSAFQSSINPPSMI